MLHQRPPIPALPTYTRIAERPGSTWNPFPFPEYPGASAAYIGPHPRILQEPAQQILKMKSAPILDESALAFCNSPLLHLKRVVARGDGTPPPGRVLAKLEGCAHCQSSKVRTASAIIRDAEFQGFLKKGMEVVEPVDHITADNGIAVASVCASMGYPCVLIMPSGVSIMQLNLMRRLGAKLVQTSSGDGITGAVSKLEEMMAQEKGKYFVARLFTDKASTQVHEMTTGAEIWEATGGKVDCLVAAVLTGATLTGVRRHFDQRGRRLQTVAVEPAEAAVLSAAMQGKRLEPRRHEMAGMGCGHVPGLLELKLLDRVERVTEADARRMAERLGAEEGIITGITGGAVMVAATRVAHDPQAAGMTIVCILPVGDPSLAVEDVLLTRDNIPEPADLPEPTSLPQGTADTLPLPSAAELLAPIMTELANSSMAATQGTPRDDTLETPSRPVREVATLLEQESSPIPPPPDDTETVEITVEEEVTVVEFSPEVAPVEYTPQKAVAEAVADIEREIKDLEETLRND